MSSLEILKKLTESKDLNKTMTLITLYYVFLFVMFFGLLIDLLISKNP